MKELIERAASVIEGHAEVSRGGGRDVCRLNDLAADLRKLAETAELRDEAWAAMKAVGVAAIACATAFDKYGDSYKIGYPQLDRERDSSEYKLKTICREVAETET